MHTYSQEHSTLHPVAFLPQAVVTFALPSAPPLLTVLGP